MVLRLKKVIYALKQASRQWKEKLVHILVDKLGFKEIYSDASLYVYAHDGLRITVPVYVDDGMMSSNSTRLLDFCAQARQAPRFGRPFVAPRHAH